MSMSMDEIDALMSGTMSNEEDGFLKMEDDPLE